jgi:NADH-quinone oxidoreductase subunit L
MAVSEPSLYPWLVIILPYAGALLIPLLRRAGRITDFVAVGFSFLSALFDLLLLVPVLQGQTVSLNDSVIPASVPWISGLGINVGVLTDPYTLIISNVVAWVSFLIMVYSVSYMKGDSGINRYWFFMNFFIGNMQLIVLSNNFLSLFIGWEGVGLCSYALIGHYFRDEKENWVGTPGSVALGEEQAYPPSHAGMKAFVMTRIGDVSFLAGILILFFYSHTFSFQALAQSPAWAVGLANAGLLVPVALLIFGGSIGKSAQFPLHEWLPDAMAGPAPVSALIHAATMVKAGVVLVARVGPLFYFALSTNPALIQPFFVTVAWIGAFTAFLAASQALVGFELKKILAYSTVSQIGYMMMALGLTGLSTDFSQGLSAGLYHLVSHAIFKASLFMGAGALIHTAHSKYINEMGGFRTRLRITFAATLIAIASLSGIPPFSGFWSKDAVLATAWDSGQLGLFAVGAVTAGITAFYSFRLLGIVFYGKPSDHLGEVEREHPVHEVGPLMWAPYTILALGTLAIGILAIPLNLEGSLEWASRSYLASLFPNLPTVTASAAAFDFVPAAIAGGFVALGVLAAAGIYLWQRAPPSRFVGDAGFMHSLYRFLENRWYINAVYYRVFVTPVIAGSKWVLDHFEIRGLFRVNDAGIALGLGFASAGNWIDTKVIDGVANAFSGAGQSLSKGARKIQTGVLENYILFFAAGLVILVLLLLVYSGVTLL